MIARAWSPMSRRSASQSPVGAAKTYSEPVASIIRSSRSSRLSVATAAAVISARERCAGRPVAACSGRIQMTCRGSSGAIPPPCAAGRTLYLANVTLCERRTRTTILLCEHCLRRVGGTMAVPATEETRYARNGEVRIAFEDLGGAGGEPLLLIMGLAVSRFWWPPGLVDELVRRGFHVVAYDQRDAGQSTHFPDTGAASPIAAVLRRRSPAYTAEDMTDDAVAVLDALGWDSAHLFGHSMGGQLAQRTALRHPGRVRSITSSASLPGDVGRLGAARYVRLGTVARLARMKFPEGHDGDIELAVAATRAIASPAYPADEQEVRRMAERDQVSGVRDTAAQSRQAGAKWHGGRLSQLRVPTLVLHGAQDPLLRPAAARRTAAAIRGARLVIVPSVGHYLPAAVYPQVADEVRALADRAATATPKPG